MNPSPHHADILVFGTGAFAARMILDIASAANHPVKVVIAGRNKDRLDWLRTAANARASLFERPATFSNHHVDMANEEAIEKLLSQMLPTVVVQAATVNVRPQGGEWLELCQKGGLSTTAIFQAVLSVRVAKIIKQLGIRPYYINACFPDVVNQMLAAEKLHVDCGVGNVGILSNAFRGATGLSANRLKVLAHYQHLAAWRLPPEMRRDDPPRVWIDDAEVSDVYDRFADVRLSAEPAIEVSGASGVPLMLAMMAGLDWKGHVPGPWGLPGGYPVSLSEGRLELDLPGPLSKDQAIEWNTSFEKRNGLTVMPDGEVRFNGALLEGLIRHKTPLAQGFTMSALDDAYHELTKLKNRLELVS